MKREGLSIKAVMSDQSSKSAAKDALSGREAGLLGLAMVKDDSETARTASVESEEAPERLMQLFPELAFGGQIGRGGFGTVWRVRHRHLGREMAMKVLAPAFRGDAATLTRFEREMQAAAQVDHAGVVRCFDAGQREGTWFLTMELVKGASLNRVLAQSGALRVADACEITRQAALALHHAHERGLVHRDVKPGNVMVCAEGVKLLDFGLAQFAAGNAALGGMSLTMSGEFVGTLDYAAPEQVESPGTADLRVDVFSLGATLWHLLSGVSPRTDRERDSSLLKRLNRIAQQPLADIGECCEQSLPAGLKNVLAKMTAHVPEDRFSSCAEVAEALQPFCEGHDLTAILAPMALEEAVEWKEASKRTLPEKRPKVWWLAAAAVLALGGYFLMNRPDQTDQAKPSSELHGKDFSQNHAAALESTLPEPDVFRAFVNEFDDGSDMRPKAVAFHPRWSNRVWMAVGHAVGWLERGEQPAPWITQTPAEGFAFTGDGTRMAWTHPGYVSHVDLRDLGEARTLAADSPWGDHALPVRDARLIELQPLNWKGEAFITTQTALVASDRQLYAVSLTDAHAPKVLLESTVPMVDLAFTRHDIIVATKGENSLSILENGQLTPLKLTEPLPPLRGVAADLTKDMLYVTSDEPVALFRLVKTPSGTWQPVKLAANFATALSPSCVAVSADGKRLTVADAEGVYVWRLAD